MRGREAVVLSVMHGGVNKQRGHVRLSWELASSQAGRQLYDMIANDKEDSLSTMMNIV
jgi:hypothetical protein